MTFSETVTRTGFESQNIRCTVMRPRNAPANWEAM